MKNEEKIITLELYKALGILISAIIVSGVGGAFLAYRTINTDHFTLASTVSKVNSVEAKVSDDEKLIPQFIQAQEDIRNIENDIKDIKQISQDNNSKLNQIIGKLSK
jgi:hypothetical protein